MELTKISHLVQHQFPEFYHEQGENFISFVGAYYEWLEQTGNLIDLSRNLSEFVDIDSTTEQFLDFFRYQYMNDLPIEIIGNQRLFQKHILELYRSKGSLAGLKLLFRLLYNEEVDVYIPSYDIFKGSDGVWITPTYLEVTDSIVFNQYEGKVITGLSTGATAVVESAHRKILEDGVYNVLYISNLHGSFAKGEPIIAEGVLIGQAAQIKGSPSSASVLTSSANFTVGDILIDSSPSKSELSSFRVSEVYDSTGIIQFDVVNGGDLYSTDAVVTITAGSNTTGIGANFRVFSLSNTSTFVYSTDIIATYANVAISSNTYGFPYNPSANQSTTINDVLALSTTTVGTIDRIAVSNPGTGYDGSVTISVTDPHTQSRGIWFGDGFGGENAVITGNSLTGIGLIKSVSVYDSGIRNNTDQLIISTHSQSNSQLQAVIRYNTEAVGKSTGYFNDTTGFISDDKYLTDGHYYQDYSYVIKSTHQLEDYIDVLKRTMHVAGNRSFSEVCLTMVSPNKIQILNSTLV